MKKIFWLIVNVIQAILTLPFTVLTALVFIPFLPFKYRHWFACKVYSPVTIFLLGGKFIVRGRENIGKNEPYVFMANHSSFIDIPILFAATNRAIRFLAKYELKKGLFGLPIRRMDMLFVDRSNAKNSVESVRHAAQMVKDGKDLAIFPEGTRTKTGQLGSFKKGSFKLALHSGVKIIPVGIQGAATILPHNFFNYRPAKVIVSIGEPIDTSHFTDETLGDLSDLVKSKVEVLLQEK